MAKLAEAAVNGLVTILQNQLAAKLVAIEEESGDGISLPMVTQVIKYFPGLQEIPQPPFVSILAGQSRPKTDTGYGGGGFADVEHELGCVVMVEDPDPAALAIKLLRYVRAVVEVAGANRVTSTWAGLNWLSIEPGQRFTPGQQTNYYDYSTIVLRVRRTEA